MQVRRQDRASAMNHLAVHGFALETTLRTKYSGIPEAAALAKTVDVVVQCVGTGWLDVHDFDATGDFSDDSLK